MEIINKLDALHAMATMRRMEISGDDCTKTGFATYCAIYDAAEAFFAKNPCAIWDNFANNSNF